MNDKKFWKDREQILKDNLKKAKHNKEVSEEQIEETEYYLKNIRAKIQTFK